MILLVKNRGKCRFCPKSREKMAWIPKVTSKNSFLIQTNGIAESVTIELRIYVRLVTSFHVGISKNNFFGPMIPSTAQLLAFLTPSYQKIMSTDGC